MLYFPQASSKSKFGGSVFMGLASKKKRDESVIHEMTPEIKAELDQLAEIGGQLEEKGQYKEAIQIWKEALELIPEPQQFYSETIWFLAAIGDVYFQKKLYRQAHECFDQARGNLSGEGYGNPFIMLRLGECCTGGIDTPLDRGFVLLFLHYHSTGRESRHSFPCTPSGPLRGLQRGRERDTTPRRCAMLATGKRKILI